MYNVHTYSIRHAHTLTYACVYAHITRIHMYRDACITRLGYYSSGDDLLDMRAIA